MKKRIVVYTVIFGPYNGLLPQTRYPGLDYICFTDQPFRSRVWDVRKIPPEFPEDLARSSRKMKILPHLYLKDYDVSIYMDGNFIVRKNPIDFAISQLREAPMLVFDHNQTKDDQRNCAYLEYEAIMEMGRVRGVFKDDPQTMQMQMERYRKEGFPEENGLISSGVLIRRHHDPAVIETMNMWWQQVQNWSRRDQLSFNYSAWKNNFSFRFLDGNLRDHEYFLLIGKHRADYRGKYFRYRLKKFFGIKK